jgi:hypothetical protein
MQNLAQLADRYANRLREAKEPINWHDLRDLLDLWSGGDLETIPLDILTDLTSSRAVKLGVKVQHWSESCMTS